MLQEDCKVGSTPERADIKLVRSLLLDHVVLGAPLGDHLVEQASVDLIRIGDLVRNGLEEVCERGRGTNGVTSSRDGDVHVEVCDDVVLEPRAKVFTKLLDPSKCPRLELEEEGTRLGRSNQAVLFGVPRSEDDRAKRLPALLEEHAKALDDLVHRRCSRVGISCTERPGCEEGSAPAPKKTKGERTRTIVVIANDDDLVLDPAGNDGHRVPTSAHQSGPCSNKRATHQIAVTLSSIPFTISTSSSPGPVQYSTPNHPNPPSFRPSEPILIPFPFKLLSNGRASSYEIGSDGIEGMLIVGSSRGSRLVEFLYAGVPGVRGSPG